jgi:hypothetical protein
LVADQAFNKGDVVAELFDDDNDAYDSNDYTVLYSTGISK